jgi:hypothetical protein
VFLGFAGADIDNTDVAGRVEEHALGVGAGKAGGTEGDGGNGAC